MSTDRDEPSGPSDDVGDRSTLGSSRSRVDRRLPRAVRVHLPAGGEEPAGGRDCAVHACRPNGSSGRTSSTVLHDATTTCIAAGLHQQHDPDRRQRRDHGGVRRDGRLRAAAPRVPAEPLINFLVLAGLIVPPAVVPDDLGAAGHRAVQDDARHDPGRGHLRARRSASCCSARSSPPSRASSTRRPSSTAPVRSGCSSAWCCRCCKPGDRHGDRGAGGGRLQRLHRTAVLPAGQRERDRAARRCTTSRARRSASGTCCSWTSC